MEGMSERAYAEHAGLSRGAVQKARKNGRLVLFPDGSINAAASDASRGAMTDPDQQMRSRGGSEGMISGPGDTSSYIKARTLLTVCSAQDKQIAVQKKKGVLVDRARAETLVFRLARQECDTWVTWHTRVASTMAAQLSAEMEKASGVMEQVKVPILGVIENMSGFTCPSCGTLTHIFHQGGGSAIAQDIGVPFLGKVPLDPAVVDCGNSGVPQNKAASGSPAASAYREITAALIGQDTATTGIATPFRWTLSDGSGKPVPVAPRPDGPAETLAALDEDAGSLHLLWADGRAQTLGARDLHIACPCAKCRDEMTGARLLDPDTVPLDIQVTRVWSVGNYALARGCARRTTVYRGLCRQPRPRRFAGRRFLHPRPRPVTRAGMDDSAPASACGELGKLPDCARGILQGLRSRPVTLASGKVLIRDRRGQRRSRRQS